MAEYTTDKKINAGFRIGGNGMMSADVFFSDVGNEFDFEKRHYNISLESRF
jgi:hypothetical protein